MKPAWTGTCGHSLGGLKACNTLALKAAIEAARPENMVGGPRWWPTKGESWPKKRSQISRFKL